MTLAELNQKYNFHDSILERMTYHENELKLYCQFCNFMQRNFDIHAYTNSDMLFIFHQAFYEISDHFCIKESGFLHQKLQGNTLSFFLENNPDEYGHLSIRAESVEIIRLRSYNL